MAHRVMACTGNDHLDATDRGQRNGGDIGIVELGVVLILPNFFGGKDTLDFTPGQPADQSKSWTWRSRKIPPEPGMKSLWLGVWSLEAMLIE